jgi:hypothetical protein
MSIVKPGPNVPVVMANGLIDPVWNEFFERVTRKLNELDLRGLADLPDVEQATPTDGDVLIWVDDSGQFEYGSN